MTQLPGADPAHGISYREGGLKVVRDMMLLVFSLSLLHNLLLGLEFTYMIPQTKHILFMTASLSFFTGALLLSALVLYQHHLRQAESVYHYSYRVTWNFFIAYSTIFFFIASGFLSFLQHKQSMNSSASLTIIPESAQEGQVMEQSGASVKDLALPADAAVPRSIVHVHVTQAKDSPSRTQVQGRRVTWAL
ncbi:transmembrane protein 225 isoform X2 [Vicugna pacos]|uniref:Transmembrane protein 225 isoform X2 n=1 Tax=Vicugna pacos TaxID=30538 RepID=A0ABM5CN17_VICPA